MFYQAQKKLYENLEETLLKPSILKLTSGLMMMQKDVIGLI